MHGAVLTINHLAVSLEEGQNMTLHIGLKRIFIFSIFFLSSFANANIDVTCTDGDCMRNGWQAYDTRTRETYYIICRDGDCQTSGWISENKGLLFNEAYCKQTGCFTGGWAVYDSNSNGLVAEITCREGRHDEGVDCLRFGWSTFEPGFGRYETRCIDNDCRVAGWDVFVPGYPAQPVRCKRGGCFETGWIAYQ